MPCIYVISISIRSPFDFHFISIPFFFVNLYSIPFQFQFYSLPTSFPFNFHSIFLSEGVWCNSCGVVWCRFQFYFISIPFPLHIHSIFISVSALKFKSSSRSNFQFQFQKSSFHLIKEKKNEKGVVAPLPPCSLFLCAQQPDGRSRHAVGDGSIDVPIKAWTARWESLFTIRTLT